MTSSQQRINKRSVETRKPVVMIMAEDEYEFGKKMAAEAGMTFAAFVGSLYHRFMKEMMSE